MLLINCPVTRTQEFVSLQNVRSLTNHPTHIAMTVQCPCGATHAYRTGRRREAAQASAPRRAEELIPA